MRVFLAEDDSQLRGLLLRALKGMGHDVEAVDDGEKLLRRAAAFAPDVVLSDIDLPLCDGIKAGLQLRRELPGTPFILMTGDSGRADEARRAGFQAVLLKPFPSEELQTVLLSF
ncbi:MAG: hypothetical protein A2V88_01290 [Elusimicrobia bacterium RBG_16_66_12]|nr:MAG: hypothetical protein A2V88_01290 [Elusimicrobia bacterium RBG_16_66_12]